MHAAANEILVTTTLEIATKSVDQGHDHEMTTGAMAGEMTVVRESVPTNDPAGSVQILDEILNHAANEPAIRTETPRAVQAVAVAVISDPEKISEIGVMIGHNDAAGMNRLRPAVATTEVLTKGDTTDTKTALSETNLVLRGVIPRRQSIDLQTMMNALPFAASQLGDATESSSRNNLRWLQICKAPQCGVVSSSRNRSSIPY